MARVAPADRPLTVKETRFAAAVAQGKPKAQAHRENYATNPEYASNARKRAVEISRREPVAAEIRRLTWLACPPADDIRGMREHAIRVISDLSRSAKSEEVRLKSALALIQIAEHTRAAANPAATNTEQDRILTALRKLYSQAQITAATPPAYDPPPEPACDPDDEVIDIRAIGEPVTEPAEPA
jgi:hypothetical protein